MHSNLIRLFSFILIVHFATTTHADTLKEPNLGETLDKKEIDFISMTVFPDGEGLPQGSGNSQHHIPALAGKPKHGSD